MAIIGFLVLIGFGLYLLYGAYGMMIFSLGFTGRPSIMAILFAIAGLAMIGGSVYYAPFEVTMRSAG